MAGPRISGVLSLRLRSSQIAETAWRFFGASERAWSCARNSFACPRLSFHAASLHSSAAKETMAGLMLFFSMEDFKMTMTRLRTL